MKKLIFLVVCLFISVSITAETVYKKTNPDGSVVFTDQPSTDTEEVKIRKPTTFSPLSLPSLRSPNKKAKPINYVVTIIEPSNDSTIIGNTRINVSVAVTPDLVQRHQFRYQLGKQTLDTYRAAVSLDSVNRGTHVLNVSIINHDGEVVSSGSSVIIHQKRFFKKAVKPKVKAP